MTYSNDIRRLALHYNYNTNIKKESLAKIFNINQKTLYNWRQQSDKNDYIGKNLKDTQTINYVKKRKKYNTKLIVPIKEYITTYINKNGTINVKKMIKTLLNKFNTSISTSTLYGWIAHLGFTYKKMYKRNTINCVKRKALVKNLKQTVKNIPSEKELISIDESHFQINEIPKRG